MDAKQNERVKKRVFLVAEAATLAHIGRILSLSSYLDPNKYDVLVAFDPRYDAFLGSFSFKKVNLKTIDSAQFLRALTDGVNPYDLETLNEFVQDDIVLIKDFKPDLIVGDFRLSLLVSANICKVPLVSVTNAHWSPFARQTWTVPTLRYISKLGAVGIAFFQFIFDIARPLFLARFMGTFKKFFKFHGLPFLFKDIRSFYCAGDYVLYPDMKEVVPTFNLPSNHVYLGPLTWSPTLPLPSWWSSASVMPGKKVFVSLGTSGNQTLVPKIIEALANKPVIVFIATVGKISISELPKNVFVAPMLPMQEVLKVVDLIVCNGGSGSINHAIKSGVPIVGIADNLDQYLCMEFVEEAGLGKLVRSDSVSTETIEATIFDTLNAGTYKRRALELQAKSGLYNESQLFNDLIDRILGDQ